MFQKNKPRSVLIMALFLLLPTNSFAQSKNENATVSIETIDFYGEAMAKWASYGPAATITINGFEINLAGPNAGGCSPVYWDPGYAGFVGEELLARKEKLRTNLSEVLRASTCDLEYLDDYFHRLAKSSVLPIAAQANTFEEWERNLVSAEKFAEDLRCLGNITFKKVFCGNM